MSIEKILGTLHLCFAIVNATYGLFSGINWFDNVYIMYNLINIILWTLLNGECFVSYLYKIYSDPSYDTYTNIPDSADIDELFPNSTISRIVINTIIILQAISLWLVLLRNSNNRLLSGLLPCMLILYIFILRNNSFTIVQKKLFNTTFFIIFSTSLLWYLYIAYNKVTTEVKNNNTVDAVGSVDGGDGGVGYGGVGGADKDSGSVTTNIIDVDYELGDIPDYDIANIHI